LSRIADVEPRGISWTGGSARSLLDAAGMKLVVLALVTFDTLAAAQPAPTPSAPPDSSEVAPPSSAPEVAPVGEPRHSFIAVHAGIESIALHESDPEYIDPSGTGFGADVEIGGRWGWAEVLGYVDFAQMSSTAADWNVHDHLIGFGVRFRVHSRVAFIGIGTGFLTGTQTGSYVDTSSGTPMSTDAHDSFSMFTAEANAGFTFPRIGGVTPELQVILEGAISFPPDEGPSATTFRVELGARF
jgi:hypothetical protein